MQRKHFQILSLHTCSPYTHSCPFLRVFCGLRLDSYTLLQISSSSLCTPTHFILIPVHLSPISHHFSVLSLHTYSLHPHYCSFLFVICAIRLNSYSLLYISPCSLCTPSHYLRVLSEPRLTSYSLLITYPSFLIISRSSLCTPTHLIPTAVHFSGFYVHSDSIHTHSCTFIVFSVHSDSLHTDS